MTTTRKTAKSLPVIVTPTQAWDHVGQQWETLGKHLGTRLEKVGATATAERLTVEHSVRDMLGAIEDALGQAGAVVRDRRLRQDVAELRQRVHEAIQLTLDAKRRRPATKTLTGGRKPTTRVKGAAG